MSSFYVGKKSMFQTFNITLIKFVFDFQNAIESAEKYGKWPGNDVEND